MTAFGKHGARCDGCGRITKDKMGYYVDRKTQKPGHITSQGRGCRHDFCDQCEDKNQTHDKCPICGQS